MDASPPVIKQARENVKTLHTVAGKFYDQDLATYLGEGNNRLSELRNLNFDGEHDGPIERLAVKIVDDPLINRVLAGDQAAIDEFNGTLCDLRKERLARAAPATAAGGITGPAAAAAAAVPAQTVEELKSSGEDDEEDGDDGDDEDDEDDGDDDDDAYAELEKENGELKEENSKLKREKHELEEELKRLHEQIKRAKTCLDP